MINKSLFTFCFSLSVFSAAGCVTTEYNLATQQEEYYLYSTDREISMGDNVSRQIEKQFDIIHDVDVNERAERILDDIVAVCDRKELVYFIKIIDVKEEDKEDEVYNAVSLPGGYIYLFKDILDLASTDDELAGIIAHEVGHITARHSIKRIQGSYAALAAQVAATQANGNVAGGVGLALNSLFMEYSLHDEYQADKLSIKYMKAAGYDPAQMVTFLKKLKAEQDDEPVRQFSYWRTHPHLSKRAAAANKEVTGELTFDDYIDLTEDPWGTVR